jgi:alpha-L-fucosidase
MLESVSAPAPYGPTPSKRQLLRHQDDFWGFIHFTVNTFTDKEWGWGDEDPNLFHPTGFDPAQIAQTAADAGMKGLILTCKHHDGFCLWPSRYTDRSVKYSGWMSGQGDAVRSLLDSCLERDLKFGVYLSPWDRNHAEYGRLEYVAYYRSQLRELLTEYGPIHEVWFDGANGGDGYYGGANETRKIDPKTYYGWLETWRIVRELAPDASIFSDVGPDLRWVGNEDGIAGDPCWATLNVGDSSPGSAVSASLSSGDRNGSEWLPAECDVSIRPGWFYHASEDDKVKTPQELVDLYYKSIGRGATLLLNLPPDRRGLIHERDVEALRGFRLALDATFEHNLAQGATVAASFPRAPAFSALNVLDGDPHTYWATEDSATSASVVLDLGAPTTFNIVRIREYLPLGQRVDKYGLDQWQNGGWIEFASGEGIGSCRLARTEKITTESVRLRVAGPVCPAISEVGIFLEPGS